MKAITLWQPWASLVAIGKKMHETRSWPTDYRGPLLITAASIWNDELRQLARSEPFLSALMVNPVDQKPLPLGCVVAVSELMDVYPTRDESGKPCHYNDLDRAFGDWNAGRYAWRLANVRKLREPVPCRGAQKLWNPSALIVAKVMAQLN